MANYFEENIEISNLFKFVKNCAKFFDKNKTIKGYLEECKESEP